MKVAAIVTGQLNRGKIHQNLKALREVLPDADIFHVTWKGQPYSPYINKYFEEPKSHYNPAYHMLKAHCSLYRKLKNNDFDPKTLKAVGYGGQQDAEWIANLIRRRQQFRHQNKQHLMYTLAYKEFVKGRGYDVCIRTRYDTHIFPEFKDVVQEQLELCYDTRRPIGNHWFPQTLREHLYRQDYLHGPVDPSPPGGIQPLIRDWLIVHRADMFDPELILSLYADKKFAYAEEGYFQMFAEPYRARHWSYHGYIGLEAQIMTTDNAQLMHFGKPIPEEILDLPPGTGPNVSATSSRVDDIVEFKGRDTEVWHATKRVYK